MPKFNFLIDGYLAERLLDDDMATEILFKCEDGNYRIIRRDEYEQAIKNPSENFDFIASAIAEFYRHNRL